MLRIIYRHTIARSDDLHPLRNISDFTRYLHTNLLKGPSYRCFHSCSAQSFISRKHSYPFISRPFCSSSKKSTNQNKALKKIARETDVSYVQIGLQIAFGAIAFGLGLRLLFFTGRVATFLGPFVAPIIAASSLCALSFTINNVRSLHGFRGSKLFDISLSLMLLSPILYILHRDHSDATKQNLRRLIVVELNENFGDPKIPTIKSVRMKEISYDRYQNIMRSIETTTQKNVVNSTENSFLKQFCLLEVELCRYYSNGKKDNCKVFPVDVEVLAYRNFPFSKWKLSGFRWKEKGHVDDDTISSKNSLFTNWIKMSL